MKREYITRFGLAWVIFPAAIGLITGAIVGAFAWLVEHFFLSTFTSSNKIWMGFLPILALPASYLCFKYIAKSFSPGNSDLFISANNSENKDLPLKQIPGRCLAGGFTVALGASQGLESPSTLIGASIGKLFENTKLYTQKLLQPGLLMTVGASAGIAAVFSSPGVGAFFGLEAPYHRGTNWRALVPASVAAICSFWMNVKIRGSVPLFPISNDPINYNLKIAFFVIALAVVCGLLARLFCVGDKFCKKIAKTHPVWLRLTLGCLSLSILAIAGFKLTGNWVTFGPGYIASGWLMIQQHSLFLVLFIAFLHTMGTLLSIYGGGAGGVFTSLALAGGFLGMSFGQSLGFDDGSFFVAIGAGCFLGSAYRIPWAGIFLILETTRNLWLAPAAIISVFIAYLIVGKQSVSAAQIPNSP